MREDFFETNLDLSKHPEQVFWIFFKFFKYLFSIFVFVWVNGELMELCAKFWNFWIDIHREIICQSWVLLTTFFNFPIVHWVVFSRPTLSYIHLCGDVCVVFASPPLIRANWSCLQRACSVATHRQRHWINHSPATAYNQQRVLIKWRRFGSLSTAVLSVCK